MTEVPICKCGEVAIMVTSWTEDNPGRRFLGCQRRYSHKILSRYFLSFSFKKNDRGPDLQVRRSCNN
ncbi:hypothetical protein LINGRAHAP2_LOCUS22556, partial [Linum grandiflorum]